VIDFEIAKQVVEDNVPDTEFSDYTEVSHDHDESGGGH
jgi:hypothetical protein